MASFADILLPVPIPRLFTYEVSAAHIDKAEPGRRVIVPFGQKKVLTGVIVQLHSTKPENYEAREILDVLDDQPVIVDQQLQLIQWMASYYMCTPGEVLNAALPSGLKLSSKSMVQKHPDFDPDDGAHTYSDSEWKVVEALEEKEHLSYDEISQITGVKNIYHLIKSLSAKGAILIFEQLIEKYKPKKERRVRLQQSLEGDLLAIEALFQKLEKKEKQLELVMKYLREVPLNELKERNQAGIPKGEFLSSGLSASSLGTLVKNGVFEEFDKVVSRFGEPKKKESIIPELTSLQEEKLSEIHGLFEKKSTVLLHGVTGSGKTEIYIRLLQQVLDEGAQALYLLPEIALTAQILRRLKKVFGDKIGIYHSKYSDNERVEVWNGVLSGRFPIVVGVRSSVFLPFNSLSLIIIDEEHESSYKQYDPAPRYHARDTAIMLGQIHHAKILLGSATPSVESYYNAVYEKYGLVTLETRFGEVQMPETALIDLKDERKKKRMHGDLSPGLLQAIEQTLEENKQVILFQNRRGYAPYLHCEDCAHIPKCANCSVSLTYHMYRQELLCHYCGFREPLPSHCEACGSAKIKTIGFGTEKLEDDLKVLLPTGRISRMDYDTTRTRSTYEQLIEDFENGEIDVLVGTQMITKGLDFDHVELVGILDIDRIIHFPDFRSHERAFQMMTQVSGRAGRRSNNGKVIIQTNNPEQPVFHLVRTNDYKRFYQMEILERESFHYPPFVRMIRVLFRNQDKQLVWETANHYLKSIQTSLGGHRILGPQEPLIARIRNQYHQEITIKLEKGGISIPKAKEFLTQKMEELQQDKIFRQTSVIFDVDPQ
ncbi:primosomal protein N' [uncultured Imperialibacter sp.]|uniref:replication restart helicase PriA n=1 Tax=uncultured Imperialibacter sp. TaxID=1672639 RepID=UPI0030DD0109|tara:strand:- start:66802 stop:69279 length:2478 start_codon:yes stop_codon:yes gene_type:complete